MTRRNFGEIAAILKAEFQATNPHPNPYVFQVNLPKGMGLKRLIKYLEPAQGIEIENSWRAGYIYVNVDEFDAEVVDKSHRRDVIGFSVQSWDDLFCIVVKSLPGEFASEEYHEVQNVNAKLYKVGEHVRVAIKYSNGTDYGARRVIG